MSMRRSIWRAKVHANHGHDALAGPMGSPARLQAHKVKLAKMLQQMRAKKVAAQAARPAPKDAGDATPLNPLQKVRQAFGLTKGESA